MVREARGREITAGLYHRITILIERMENVIMPCDRISKNIPYIIIFILNWVVKEGGLLRNQMVKTSMALCKEYLSIVQGIL
jgi:hypothetical protein